MSSVVIWRDEATGTTASWNKQGPYTVFVPLRIDHQGICDGLTTEWASEKTAVAAAEKAARERLEEMRSEDPKHKRFSICADWQASRNATPEVRDLTWFYNDQRFDAAALAEISKLPVAGVFRRDSLEWHIAVQRVE